MSVPIYVGAYSGYRANERPLAFSLTSTIGENGVEGVYDIDAVEDRWYDPNAEYFKVRTSEGKLYILRHDEREDRWTLQSGFDGAELLARPGIEFITVQPEAIRRAELQIVGCERCRSAEADHPFDCVLADVLGKHGAFEFILSEPGRCPNCKADLTEKTLVEPWAEGRVDEERGGRADVPDRERESKPAGTSVDTLRKENRSSPL